MATFTIAEGKNKFTAVIKQAESQPVEITRRGVPVAVILSVEEYQEFQRLKKKKRSFRGNYSGVAARLDQFFENRFTERKMLLKLVQSLLISQGT